MIDLAKAQKIAVLGAGAWGTALANAAAAREGRDVVLWARDGAHVAEMARDRENRRRLPGVALSKNVEPQSDLATAVAHASYLSGSSWLCGRQPSSTQTDGATTTQTFTISDSDLGASSTGGTFQFTVQVAN